jgi:hypothetical protein
MYGLCRAWAVLFSAMLGLAHRVSAIWPSIIEMREESPMH